MKNSPESRVDGRRRAMVGAALASTVLPAAAQLAKPTSLIIAGGSQGTGSYKVMVAIAQLLQKKIPGMTVTVQATSGSSENARLVGEGNAHFCLSSTELTHAALQGNKPFDKPLPIRALLSGHEAILAFVAREGSGINSIRDIKGKRVSPGAAGSGGALFFPLYARALGLEPGKDFSSPLMGYADAGQAMQEGVIDAVFAVAKPVAPMLKELAMSSKTKIKFINFEPAVFQKAIGNQPFWTLVPIASESLPNQQKDVSGVLFPVPLIVNRSMDADLARLLTRTILENSDELGKITFEGYDYNIKRWADGVNVPFHKGAVAYYTEKGVWAKRPASAVAGD